MTTTQDQAGAPTQSTTARTRTAPRPKPATAAKHLTAGAPTACTTARPVTAPRPPDEWGDLRRFRILAEGLSDAKKVRVATENRVKRGGQGLDPETDLIMDMVARAHTEEDWYADRLLYEYHTAVPARVQDWASRTPGIATGPLFPRLLGLLGNPRIATPYRRDGKDFFPDGEPYERTLRQLWQYCGCGDPDIVPRSDILGRTVTQADKLAAGKRTTIRPLLYTFSTILVRSQRFESVANSYLYRAFIKARADADAKAHHRQCQNKNRPPLKPNGCGTKDHPEWGAPGSPWRKGHKNAHAHRIVAKEFLRELWVISGDE